MKTKWRQTTKACGGVWVREVGPFYMTIERRGFHSFAWFAPVGCGSGIEGSLGAAKRAAVRALREMLDECEREL